MNPAQQLAQAATRCASRVAVRFDDRAVTYSEFYDRAARLGGAFRSLGLEPGDRVGIVARNCPEVLETFYGAFMAGLVVVPVNTRLHPREVAYIAGDAEFAALVHSDDLNESLADVAGEIPGLRARISTAPTTGELAYSDLIDSAEPLPSPYEGDPDTLAWLFYTSGTTGRPKGVMWNYRTIHNIVINHLADLYSYEPGDVALHLAALSHAAGIVAMSCFARGAENLILHTKSFDPDAVFQLIQDRQVTAISVIVPTQILVLLDAYVPGRYDLSSLRSVLYGAAPMYQEHLHRAFEMFGPILIQGYGQGESPNTITYLSQADHERFLAAGDARLTSVGVARTGVEVRVADANDETLAAGEIGEVLVRGDIVMPGYWRNDEATREALRGGWLHTGDVGTFDGDSYLYLLDRAKDMIISGGSNIYPREIEEILLTHPAIAECAVIGVPDDYWGERVHAVLCLRNGTTIELDEVARHCSEHLASYKKPTSMELRDELPKSAYGKVLKRELVADYRAAHEREPEHA
jgi:long-chain acyl-CoA synthetase